MKVIRTKNEKMTVEEKYAMTMSPEIGRMRDIENQIIPVDNWMIYNDVDKDGKEQTLLSILSDGRAYATNSVTFIETFTQLNDLFTDEGMEIPAVKIIGGTSKAGRHFITCAYARLQ